MKNKDKYENKNENKAESQNDEQVEAEVKEDEKKSFEIEREGLSDEEYIAALEEKLGQAIAEAETCKGLTQRLQADFDNYRKRNNSIAEDMKQLGQSIVIEKMLSGRITTQCPGTLLLAHADVTLIVDKDAFEG